MIDLKNIGRLKSTKEVLDLCYEIYDVILDNIEVQEDGGNQTQQGQQGEGGEGDEEGDKKDFPKELPTIVEYVPMSQEQFARYTQFRILENEEAKFSKKDTSRFADNSGSSSSYRVKSRQVSNYFIPEHALGPVRGNKTRERFLDKLTKEDLLNRNYSPKMFKMIENIKKSKGLGIVYSQFVSGEGIAIFAKILDNMNYVNYNQKLSERRVNSIIEYFKIKTVGDANLAKFIESGELKIISEGSGEITTIPKAETEVAANNTTATTTNTTTGFEVNCNENIKDKTNQITSNSQTYSVSAMACRRVRVSNISVTALPQPEVKQEPDQVIKTTEIKKGTTTITEYPPTPKATVDIVKRLKANQ
jgi:hypothetical protein